MKETTENTMKYANLISYSDVLPFEVVAQVSSKTMVIREMAHAEDGQFKPEFVPGGFAAHCINQSDQKHFYKSDFQAPLIRMRLQKDGSWKSKMGIHKLAGAPKYFHDYNF